MIGWLTGFHTDVYWVQGEYCQTDTSSLYSFSNKRDRTQLAVGVSKPYTYILGGVKYHALDKYFPGMKNKYIRTYGNAYDCHGPNNERLLDLWNF